MDIIAKLIIMLSYWSWVGVMCIIISDLGFDKNWSNYSRRQKIIFGFLSGPVITPLRIYYKI